MTTIEQAPDHRAALIVDLRAFADLLERRPDMPAPQHVSVQHTVSGGDDTALAEVERIAAVLGVDVSRTNDRARATLDCGRVEYCVYASTDRLSAEWEAATSYFGAVAPGLVTR